MIGRPTGILLAERLASARDAVPEHVLEAARLHLLDALGVGVVAAAVGPVRGVVATAADWGAGRCTVIGSDRRVPAAAAALLNGTLIHSLEYDDTHVASVMHGSSVVAPVALAVAEEVHASGHDLLTAFAVGWELLVRIGLASPGRIQTRGFQITSAAGAFAAAAISCLLHGDDADTTARAIGIAGSQAAGTFAFLEGGDTVKAAQPGWAAHAGVAAAQLARAGVTGPMRVFEGRYGFFSLYADDPDAGERLISSFDDLGSVWHLPEAAYKLVPCCHYIHPFVEALESLVADGLAVDDVESLHCWVPDEVVAIIASDWDRRQRPAKAHDARWSLPYVLALVLVHGRIAVSAFDGEIDPTVAAVAQRMTFETWSSSGFPSRFPSRLRVRRTDGSEVEASVSDVRGGRGRTVAASDVLAKARANLTEAGADGLRAHNLMEALMATEPDIDAIGRGLRPAEEPVGGPERAGSAARYSPFTRAGDLVLVSGQVSIGADGEVVGEGDFLAQAHQVFANLDRVLRSAGSDLSRVVKVTIFLTDRSFIAHLPTLRQQYFTEPWPADTSVVVAGLAREAWLLEVDAIAAVDPVV